MQCKWVNRLVPCAMLLISAGCLVEFDEGLLGGQDAKVSACGSIGDPCCIGSSCSQGYCVAGKCVGCGKAGEQCCAGDTCETTTLVCVVNVCTACGGAGQPCCKGGICTVLGFKCSKSEICEAVPPDAGVDVTLPVDTTPPIDAPPVDAPPVDASPVDAPPVDAVPPADLPTSCKTWASWTCFSAGQVCVSHCSQSGTNLFTLTCSKGSCSCENAALQSKICGALTGSVCSDCQAAFTSGCCSGL